MRFLPWFLFKDTHDQPGCLSYFSFKGKCEHNEVRFTKNFTDVHFSDKYVLFLLMSLENDPNCLSHFQSKSLSEYFNAVRSCFLIFFNKDNNHSI